ncbi:MAG: type IV secretory system conjugative DNA transfer family protein [bacterium]|nr:type IV secretory system conjugative DNA transfer family protein [bacterium]
MNIISHRRESEERAAALTLAFVDPICAIVAGLGLGHYAYIAIESLLHGGGGYRPFHVIFFIGVALIVANPMAPLAALAKGVGYPPSLFSKARGNAIAFWAGVAIVMAAGAPTVIAWVQTSVSYFDYVGTSALTLAALGAFINGFGRAFTALAEAGQSAATHAQVKGKNRAQRTLLAGGLLLCGGVARGIFRERNLAVGAPQQGTVLLYGEHSARRGTIVVGSPGSSKTRSKVYPDLFWGLKTAPRAGALVFVTKRRATIDCYRIARTFRPADRIHVIGIGSQRETMDITAGMSHESIGDAIRDGIGASNSDFWIHGPAAFTEGFIEIIQALAPATIAVPALADKDGVIQPGNEAYDLTIGDTLPTLLQLLVLDARRLDAIFSYGFQRADAIKDSRSAAALRELLREVKGRTFPLLQREAKLGEEFRQSVLPQLQPFARGVLRETFCDRNGIDLSLLEQGRVILVEIDETEHPRAVGAVIRMIFRRIVQMARERTASNRAGSLDPILLLCDEYTNYAAPGHVQAWNTIRESDFVATVGITSISALAKQLGGDQNATNAIVANFANKFFFEVDDKLTRDLARELIGQTTVLRRGTTEGTSQTSGNSSSVNMTGSSHSSRGTSRSESSNEHREDALDGAIWRSLGAAHEYATAIAFVRASDGVATDVVTLGVLDPAEGILTALPEEYGVSH